MNKIVLDGIKPEDRITALDILRDFSSEKMGIRAGVGYTVGGAPEKIFYVWRNKSGVVIRAYYHGKRLHELTEGKHGEIEK